MRCYPAISRERCVQSSLPCVSSSGKKSQASKLMALSVGRFLWKDCLQKRIETGKIRCGNHLGCPSGAEMGLRYGLSGNRVSAMETDRRGRERETASFGDERFAHGENKPDLSRKINHFCRHCFIFAQHRPNLTHRRLHFCALGVNVGGKSHVIGSCRWVLAFHYVGVFEPVPSSFGAAQTLAENLAPSALADGFSPFFF